MVYLAAMRSIHLEDLAFGVYYHRMVERSLKKGSALLAIIRELLAVAAHLLSHEQEKYDPSKFCAGVSGHQARRQQHRSD